MSRCNNCWGRGAYPDSVFVHISSLSGNPYALWTPVDAGNGKWAFRSDSGKYLGRCNNCVPGGAYPDFGFVHVDNYANSPWAQWNLKTV